MTSPTAKQKPIPRRRNAKIPPVIAETVDSALVPPSPVAVVESKHPRATKKRSEEEVAIAKRKRLDYLNEKQKERIHKYSSAYSELQKLKEYVSQILALVESGTPIPPTLSLSSTTD